MPNILDIIMARCTTYGECILWDGPMANGSPQLFIDGKYRQARRLVHEASTGEPIRKGYHPIMKCREPACLNKAHMRLFTVKQIAQLAAKEGRMSSPQRRAAIVAGRRVGKGTKLTLEVAREIRMSDESGPALALRFGINRSLVNRIKRGEVWAEAANGASVFNYRPSA